LGIEPDIVISGILGNFYTQVSNSDSLGEIFGKCTRMNI